MKTILSKKIFFVSILMICLSVTSVRGQRRGYEGYLSKLISAYADSLSQQSSDTSHINLQTPVNSNYRLFTPLALYYSPLQNSLETGKVPDKIDKVLLHVYLTRPDLVKTTERNLKAVGSPEETKQVKVHPDIVDIIAPQAQEPEAYPLDLVISKPNFWSLSAEYYMQFLQNYVSSNWYKGGQSNYSMVGGLTVQANYNNKQKVRFDNKLELKLGFQATRDDSLHNMKTSEDLIRYTGKLGLQASNHWYYTDYNVNWLKQRLTGSVHLAPIAYNFKYVDRLSLSTRYGLDEGKHQLNDYGSEINLDLTYKFATNMKWSSRLYFYTTYKRTELEWENTVILQINRFLTTNILLYPRFDDGSKKDNHHGYWQLKEYCSLGFTFQF